MGLLWGTITLESDFVGRVLLEEWGKEIVEFTVYNFDCVLLLEVLVFIFELVSTLAN